MDFLPQLRLIAKSKDGSELPLQTSQEDLSKGYYTGQEFIEDPEQMDVFIRFTFYSRVIFSNINFDHEKLHVRQLKDGKAGEILCTIEKKISKKLFTIISALKDPQEVARATGFVLGYIKPCLPIINEHIQKLKYQDGHLLAQTVSISSVYDVFVVNKVDKSNVGFVVWPIPLSGFPPSKLNVEQDAVFIRDLIDAMTAYFDYNLDDCIRKVITSLENCFLHYKLQLPPKTFTERIKSILFGKRTKLRKLIDGYVQPKNYPYIDRDLKILRENILFIYNLRNRIVHDKLRINPNQTVICRKAIDTLQYIYQGAFLSSEHRSYIFSLMGQFLIICEQFGGVSLEKIELVMENSKKKEPGIIKNKDDMDKWKFSSLRIKDREKKDVQK